MCMYVCACERARVCACVCLCVCVCMCVCARAYNYMLCMKYRMYAWLQLCIHVRTDRCIWCSVCPSLLAWSCLSAFARVWICLCSRCVQACAEILIPDRWTNTHGEYHTGNDDSPETWDRHCETRQHTTSRYRTSRGRVIFEKLHRPLSMRTYSVNSNKQRDRTTSSTSTFNEVDRSAGKRAIWRHQ